MQSVFNSPNVVGSRSLNCRTLPSKIPEGKRLSRWCLWRHGFSKALRTGSMWWVTAPTGFSCFGKASIFGHHVCDDENNRVFSNSYIKMMSFHINLGSNSSVWPEACGVCTDAILGQSCAHIRGCAASSADNVSFLENLFKWRQIEWRSSARRSNMCGTTVLSNL